jgi:hypothetical protein
MYIAGGKSFYNLFLASILTDKSVMQEIFIFQKFV